MAGERTISGQNRVLLLINAKSRRGEEFRKSLREKVGAAGILVDNERDFACEDFTSAICEAAPRIDAVFVAGGDGSMNAAIEGILRTNRPLGVLPLGTSNNLARNLGLALDPFDAVTSLAEALHARRTRRIDLGSVNGLPFFNVAGMGLSIAVNREVPAESKRRWGMIAYAATALRAYRNYRPFRAEINSETGGDQCLRSFQISVCNGRHFGSGLSVSDSATMGDGVLHLYSVKVESIYEMFQALIGVKTGRHAEQGPTLVMHGPEFTVRTSRPVKIDVDGEIRTKTPAVFKVLPRAILMLSPPPVAPIE